MPPAVVLLSSLLLISQWLCLAHADLPGAAATHGQWSKLHFHLAAGPATARSFGNSTTTDGCLAMLHSQGSLHAHSHGHDRTANSLPELGLSVGGTVEVDDLDRELPGSLLVAARLCLLSGSPVVAGHDCPAPGAACPLYLQNLALLC